MLTYHRVQAIGRGLAFIAKRGQNHDTVNAEFRNQLIVSVTDCCCGVMLISRFDKDKIISIQQVRLCLIDVLRVVDNPAGLCLAENLIQHGHGDFSAINELTEYIPRANAWKLICVANQNHFGSWGNSGEKLFCKPHIYHRGLIYDDETHI